MIIHLILNEIKLILKKCISDNYKDETFFRKLKSYKVKNGQIFIKNKRVKLFTVSGSREIISFITHLLESSQYPKEDRGNLHTNILVTSCEDDTKVRTNYSRVQNPCDQLIYSVTLFNFSPKTI